MTVAPRLGEDDECPAADCTGTLVSVPDGDCSCHLEAPCPACENATLVCVACGEAADQGTNQ